MLTKKLTQEDHVAEYEGYKPKQEVVQLALPGIESLHQKPTTDVAAALANVLKSRPGIVELRWKIGNVIELVVEN